MDKYLDQGETIKLSNKSYTIDSFLGSGATCAAYKASCNGKSCILKEYNPRFINVHRNESGALYVENIKNESTYISQKERFIKSINVQKHIREISDLKNQTPYVTEFHYGYNTCYIELVDYNGQTFEQAFDNMNIKTRLEICLSLAKLVDSYHKAGYVCLDIKPSNIFVLPETTDIIEYIDFDSIKKESEILSEGYISYSKEWAAPEQINIYKWNNISRKSDIYSLGEMIFYSCFNRHSYSNEHRLYSVVPFYESDNGILRNKIVQNLLKNIFKGTLRPSVNSRFDSVSNIITHLNELLVEISKRTLLIRKKVHSGNCFVGREEELKRIDAALQEDPTIFLCGIGGIGKSELVKRYVELHKNEYDNIVFLTFDGSLERTICNDDELQFTDMLRYIEETDEEYCERKLECLSEIFGVAKNPLDNLIVLDGMDVSLCEIKDKSAWQQLQRLNARLIITTRYEPTDRTTIKIEEISDENMLVDMFCMYSGINHSDKDEYIRKIIHHVEGHTLVVELIAKNMKASHIEDPEEMFIKLSKLGIYDLEANKIIHNDKEDTVSNHIKNLMKMNELNEYETICLMKLSYMPMDGIDINTFKEFWKYKDFDIVNKLIAYGWIKLEYNNISLHDVIREIVISETRSASELPFELFCIASVLLISNYDDEEDRNNYKNAFIQNYKLTKDISEHYFSPSKIDQATYIKLIDSIANTIVSNNIISNVVNFGCPYVALYMKYGNPTSKLSFIEYLLDYKLESLNYEQREMLYYYQIKIKLLLCEDKYAIIDQCSRLLSIAEKNTKYYSIALWSSILSQIYSDLSLKDSRKYHKMGSKYLKRGRKREEFLLLWLNDAIANEYENNAESAPIKLFRKFFYKAAIIWRGSTNKLIASEDSTMAHIDMAKILLIDNKTDEAIAKLREIISFYKDNDYFPNYALLSAYKSLADISYDQTQYDESAKYIDEYIFITEQMGISISNDLIQMYYKLACIYYIKGKNLKSLEVVSKCFPTPKGLDKNLEDNLLFLLKKIIENI